MLPLARQENLTIEHLPDETLIYDRTSGKAHCLNRTAAFVWKNCDGKTSVRDLTMRLQRESGAPVNEAVVELALEQLRRRDLLAAGATAPLEARRVARREVLRGLGLAAAALPLVMTLTAKGVAQSSSQMRFTTTSTTPNMQMLFGVCKNGASCNGPGTCGFNAQNVAGFCFPGANGQFPGTCSC